MSTGPDIVIAPNLLLNLAGFRRPASKRQVQESRLSQAGAAGVSDDVVKDAAAWASEQELRRALQSTERVNGLLLKKETEEAGKVEQWVDDLLSKHARIETKPLPCSEERQGCINCLKGSEQAGLQSLLKCAKYVDAYEGCVSTALKGTS